MLTNLRPFRGRARGVAAIALVPLLLAAVPAAAAPPRTANTNCNAAPATPSVLVDLPGSPFQALPTADGCWIFASLMPGNTNPKPGVAVLGRGGGKLSLVRVVPVEGSAAAGMVISHDGKLLLLAAGTHVAVMDVERLTSGAADPIVGDVSDTREKPGHIYVNLTADDRLLFVSDESAATITVIDFAAARAARFVGVRPLGRIPVGRAPIALTFSPDERYLYSTSQARDASSGWPVECKPQDPAGAQAKPNHTQGAVFVVDVKRAKADPTGAVIGIVKAGCNPVRLATSPKGDVAYVSARGEDALLAFDTAKLLADPANALIGKVPVGTSPVGVAVIDEGKKVVVTNSNRFGGGADDKQSLTVVDAGKIRSGAAAVLGSIPAGGFPRELRVTADGHTLLLTNFSSRTLQVIDLGRLPMTAPR